MDLFEIPARQRAAFFAALARIVIRRARRERCLYVAQGGGAVAVVTRSDAQVGARAGRRPAWVRGAQAPRRAACM